MGAYQDPIQGAVVFATAVVLALLNGALDTLVGMTMTAHRNLLNITEGLGRSQSLPDSSLV